MQENLCKEPMSSIIYSSLFELVTGTVRRQSKNLDSYFKIIVAVVFLL